MKKKQRRILIPNRSETNEASVGSVLHECLPFMHILSIEILTTFVPILLFMYICITNSLGIESQYFSSGQRLGRFAYKPNIKDWGFLGSGFFSCKTHCVGSICLYPPLDHTCTTWEVKGTHMNIKFIMPSVP